MISRIALREIITRARTKPFIILTAILLLGVIAAAVVVGLVTSDTDEASEVTIGVTGAGEVFTSALEVPTDDIIATVIVTSDGEQLLDDGEIDVLFNGDELLWENFVQPDLDLFIRTTVQQANFGERAAELGLSNADLGTLFTEAPIEERLLDGESDERILAAVAAGVSTVATFLILQVWGSFLMMGVVEEKSSRVVEVLLSHVSARTLLSGKILGLGVLALLQMLIVIIGLIVGLLAVGDIEIPREVWSTVPLLFFTFLLGFAFYAAIFAAVGSTVSRQEDAQTAQLPAMLPLFIGYILAFSSFANPDSIALTIASFVPFTAPVVLPFRVALANPPLWQTLLALAILATSVPLVINLASKIYRGTLLHVGARVPLLKAFQDRNAAA